MDVESQSPTATDPKNPSDTSEPSNGLSVIFEHVDLTEENPQSEGVEFLIEKKPIEIENGKTYGVPSGVMIDEDAPEAVAIATEAQAIKNLPEEERVSKLMELFRNHLEYAYPDSVNDLEKIDPEKALWIKEKILGNPSEVKLSEVLSSGFGICRHLSVVYLWLAQKAGLEGVLLKSDPMLSIQNIVRTDTNLPLFKMTAVGKNVPSHTWVELRLSTGEWIPVDPSTNLVGDTEERLKMFKNANYKGAATYDLKADIAQRGDVSTLFLPAFYDPGSPTAKSAISANILQHMDFTTGERGVTPYSGRVDVLIHSKEDYLDSRSVVKGL